jgi:hypothetical protein
MGVIARMPCSNPSAPTVALRAEMDALPGDESTGLPFASEHRGCVHCGHDAHMAMVLEDTRLLAREGAPQGEVVLLFQPAEEARRGGADDATRPCSKGASGRRTRPRARVFRFQHSMIAVSAVASAGDAGVAGMRASRASMLAESVRQHASRPLFGTRSP